MRSHLFVVGRRQVQLGLLTTIALAALGMFAAPAFARVGLRTVTDLSSSAQSVGPTGSVKITATIHPGLLVTALGSVTFADATTNTSLGTLRPAGLCLLYVAPCSVSISIPGSDLAAGPNKITGTYSGNTLQAPSTGMVIVNGASTTTCTASETSCSTPIVTSADGSADALITTDGPSTGTETIDISFQTQELDCSTSATGDPVVFSATNAGGDKYVQYTVYGTAANNADTAYNDEYEDEELDGWGCYESPASFTTATGNPATLGSDGLYYGILPYCFGGGEESDYASSEDSDPSNVPCYSGVAYYTVDGTAAFTDYFVVSQNDPKASN